VGSAVIIRDGLKKEAALEATLKTVSEKVDTIKPGTGSSSSEEISFSVNEDGDTPYLVASCEHDTTIDFSVEDINDEDHLVLSFYEDVAGTTYTGTVGTMEFNIVDGEVTVTYP
jgi:hypothetical protein